MSDYPSKVSKIFALIRLLSGIRSYSREEIEDLTGIPKTTFHNYVNELKQFGVYIIQKDGRYIYSREHSSVQMEFDVKIQIETLEKKNNPIFRNLFQKQTNWELSFYNLIQENQFTSIPSDIQEQVKKDFITFLQII
jgi:biotin operon repressor